MKDLTILNAFVSGALALGFGAIALFFHSFWRRTKIRLFGLFALAVDLGSTAPLGHRMSMGARSRVRVPWGLNPEGTARGET